MMDLRHMTDAQIEEYFRLELPDWVYFVFCGLMVLWVAVDVAAILGRSFG